MQVSLFRADTFPTKWVMISMWAAYTAAYFSFFYVFQDAREIADASLDGYLEVILLGIPLVLLLGGIMWLRDANVDADLRPRIVVWMVGLASVFVIAMYMALFVVETRFDPGERWLILLFSVGFGGTTGMITGIVESLSKQRERQRNRSIQLARQTERKRNRLEHLNYYLRHEVLNEVQKINGATAILADSADLRDTEEQHLKRIEQSSNDIGVFIQSIRKILNDSDHTPDSEPIDIVPLLEEEASRIEDGRYDVDFELSAPDSAYVLGGDLLYRVFRNLIDNAIQHNRSDVSIDIRVEADDEWVTVSTRDDGEGIPDSKREDLFEPSKSGDHGYGLYLMKNLVDIYGGNLELVESGPAGTEFSVRLQRGSPSEQSEQPISVAA